MAKYKLNQLKDGDMYWTPEFAEDVRRFETNYVHYDVGCWGDIVDGWAFDNEDECSALCCQMNAVLRQFKNEPKDE